MRTTTGSEATTVRVPALQNARADAAARMPYTIHIFDSGYGNQQGHHASYTDAICEEARRRGIKTIVYATGPVRGNERNSTIVPLFRYAMNGVTMRWPISGILNRLIGTIRENLSYLADLRSMPVKPAVGDIALFHTLNHRQLLAVALWHRSLREADAPCLILFLRYSVTSCHSRKHGELRAILYRLALRTLCSGRNAQRVLLATDSHELAAEFRALTGYSVHVLPIPLARHYVESATTSTFESHCGRFGDAGREKWVDIVCAGPARDEKGSHLIPTLVKATCGRPGGPKIRFIVQTALAAQGAKQTRAAVINFRADRNHVLTVNKRLGPHEYYELLQMADIVLLPYVSEKYVSGTSGIFAEAVALGKPVIAPRGTWMAAQLARIDGGGVLFDREDPYRSLINAVQVAVDKTEVLSRQALAAANRWRAMHNISAYLDALLALRTMAEQHRDD